MKVDHLVVGSADLDTVSPSSPPLNRRWVLLHLIEEVARHAGHADIIREAIDGSNAFVLIAEAEAALF